MIRLRKLFKSRKHQLWCEAYHGLRVWNYRAELMEPYHEEPREAAAKIIQLEQSQWQAVENQEATKVFNYRFLLC